MQAILSCFIFHVAEYEVLRGNLTHNKPFEAFGTLSESSDIVESIVSLVELPSIVSLVLLALSSPPTIQLTSISGCEMH